VGAFFTNVQVHVGQRSPTEARERILTSLRSWIVDQDFSEILGDEAQEADRSILVGPLGDRPWISVYDEACEDQDPSILVGLTERLSHVAGAAVGVLDHDSDILQLWLYRDGAQVDEFNSHPNYFVGANPGREPLGRAELEAVGGHPERWGDLLVAGALPGQLRSAWDSEVVFAEEMLARVADLLDWDPSLSATGFNYVSRGDAPYDAGEFTRLAFRAAANAGDDPRAAGLARLTAWGGQQELQIQAGQPFESVSVTFLSTGGPGVGMRIVIWGTALELLEMREMRLVTGIGLSGAMPEVRSIPLTRAANSSLGVPVLHAELADFAIPTGVGGGPATSMPGVGRLSSRRMQEMQAAALVGLHLNGTGAHEGQGELNVGVTPLENPQEGEDAWTLNVVVSAA